MMKLHDVLLHWAAAIPEIRTRIEAAVFISTSQQARRVLSYAQGQPRLETHGPEFRPDGQKRRWEHIGSGFRPNGRLLFHKRFMAGYAVVQDL